MGRSSALLVALFLTFGSATAAHSALLYWQGSLKLQLGSWPTFHSDGTGVATVNGSSGLGHLSTLRLAGGISPIDTTILTTDGYVPSAASQVISASLQPGTVAPISGGGPLTWNTMPLQGIYKLCVLLVGCSASVDIPFTEGGSRGLGIGGLVTFNGFGAGIRVSVKGAPWTVATARLTGLWTTNEMIPPAERTMNGTLSIVGFAHGPVSGTSTASANGVLQVVSAGRVETTLMGTWSVMGAPTVLKLVFVPEPGLLLLLASGVGGLALLGRNRLRRLESEGSAHAQVVECARLRGSRRRGGGSGPSRCDGVGGEVGIAR